MSRRLSQEQRARPGRLVALLIAVALGAGSAVVLRGAARATDAEEAEREAYVDAPLIPKDVLLPVGRTVDPTRPAQTTLPLMRPDTEVASDASIKAVWANPPEAHPQVAFEYQSGLRVYLAVPAFTDAATEYEGLIKNGSVEGTVETVNGVPALVVPPDATTGKPGSIDLVIGGCRVSMVGHGDLTLEQLMDAAMSLQVDGPISGLTGQSAGEASG